jgi:hypothetical protein
MNRWVAIAAVTLASVPGEVRAQAFRPERVDIRGFGGWSFGRTSDNRFLGADPNGEYTKANFALKIGAAVSPTVQISAQINWRNFFDGSETSLDYAFAEWQVAEGVGVRAGKVKQPFGIYSEVAGIGTVRPFLNLPAAVYGPVGFISKSYRGLGIRGSAPLGGGWSLDYDVYGGGIEFEQEESVLELMANPVVDSTIGGDPFASRDVLGGRLVLGLPVDGLALGLSAYTGIREGIENPNRYRVLGGQLEYLTDRLWMRGELLYQTDRLGILDDRAWAGYLELAAFATDKLQPALQYNRIKVILDESGLGPYRVPDPLKKHSEWAFGLNYWVQPELGFKVSWHSVEGNIMSSLSPLELQQLLYTGVSPHPETRLLQLGVQFSF